MSLAAKPATLFFYMTQRLLNQASWDTTAAMSVVRRFAAKGLEEAARRGRRGGMVIAVDPPRAHHRSGEVLLMGLPLDLEFRTKGQLAIGICTAAYADGIGFDFACGNEVYGNCT